MKKILRLNESELIRVVRKIIKESQIKDETQYPEPDPVQFAAAMKNKPSNQKYNTQPQVQAEDVDNYEEEPIRLRRGIRNRRRKY